MHQRNCFTWAAIYFFNFLGIFGRNKPTFHGAWEWCNIPTSVIALNDLCGVKWCKKSIERGLVPISWSPRPLSLKNYDFLGKFQKIANFQEEAVADPVNEYRSPLQHTLQITWKISNRSMNFVSGLLFCPWPKNGQKWLFLAIFRNFVKNGL